MPAPITGKSGAAGERRRAMAAWPRGEASFIRLTRAGLRYALPVLIGASRTIALFDPNLGRSEMGHSTKSLRSSPLRGARGERPVAS